MGLDMYINGRRNFVGALVPAGEQHPDYDKARAALAEQVGQNAEVEIAYWRKHPNLHGFIVQNYADGVDECQEIPLDEARLTELLEAAKDPASLPPTQGFFFGTSDGSEVDDDVHQLTEVLAWLRTADDDPAVRRTVFYCASW